MKCEHCTRKECSKKTKTDDQENVSADAPSPAQENGEASRFFSFVSAQSKLLLLFFSLGAHSTVHITALKKTEVRGHGGSRLESQHFGRPRWTDHLRSGV
ncbi:nuclear prelamin A recognition factor [Homo sapiens]|uniref:Nuclear prelamin A recognition factor n=1 Tax=Homo sapiens TaxID=9606 RepID=J3QLT6_HUMAN|nr:nuclear prelamin A recognition factor [Homo sapiens]KAI2585898.1 nuclear prelamin A recognition factor [Homo sapiens]KAI4052412.1 nuclear prelamin A recognition factor [Homo sapiens]KAI4052419.1 nuclear prelamin A recognition factor [Homo sapiens]